MSITFREYEDWFVLPFFLRALYILVVIHTILWSLAFGTILALSWDSYSRIPVDMRPNLLWEYNAGIPFSFIGLPMLWQYCIYVVIASSFIVSLTYMNNVYQGKKVGIWGSIRQSVYEIAHTFLGWWLPFVFFLAVLVILFIVCLSPSWFAYTILKEMGSNAWSISLLLLSLLVSLFCLSKFFCYLIARIIGVIDTLIGDKMLGFATIRTMMKGHNLNYFITLGVLLLMGVILIASPTLVIVIIDESKWDRYPILFFIQKKVLITTFFANLLATSFFFYKKLCEEFVVSEQHDASRDALPNASSNSSSAVS